MLRKRRTCLKLDARRELQFTGVTGLLTDPSILVELPRRVPARSYDEHMLYSV